MRSIDLLDHARQLSALVNGRHVSEDHAVAVLADAAGRDPTALRQVALSAAEDADVLPLTVALLRRAAERAEHPPPPRRARAWPDAGSFQAEDITRPDSDP